MAKLGFPDLGIMGGPMARKLMEAGHDVALWSQTASEAAKLALTEGGTAGARPADVAAKAPATFRRDFAANFAVKWLAKDVRLMLDSDGELGVPAPLTALSRRLLRAAAAKGFVEDAICGSIRPLEDLAGCTVAAGNSKSEAAS